MKYIALILALMVPISSFADRKGSPFPPYLDERFDTNEDAIDAVESQNSTLLSDEGEAAGIAKKIARAEYDVAVDGGQSTSHDLGIDLPAGAIIESVKVFINTEFSDTGTSSVALQCAGTRDLMEWQDLDAVSVNKMLAGKLNVSANFGSGTFIANQSAASALDVSSVVTACNVTAVVRSDAGYVPLSAGKLTLIVEYFDAD